MEPEARCVMGRDLPVADRGGVVSRPELERWMPTEAGCEFGLKRECELGCDRSGDRTVERVRNQIVRAMRCGALSDLDDYRQWQTSWRAARARKR